MKNKHFENKKIPVYRKIEKDIKNMIISGELKPNSQIPSEKELAEKYDVSRMTARNAVTQLVNKDYLYRVQGKGTFVSKPRIEKDTRITGFMESMNQKGYYVSSEVLNMRKIIPEDEIKNFFDFSQEDKCYELSRLRYTNEEPIVIQRAYIPENKCPELNQYNFVDHSLYTTLNREYNIIIDHAEQKLEAVAANENQANLLDINAGDPLLYIRRLSYLADNTPIEYVESWYRGDRYVYQDKIPD